MFSYTTISLSHYLDDNNTTGIFMSTEQASWFACLTQPTQMIGLVAFSWLPDRNGRKMTLIGSTVLILIGLLVLFVAPSYYFLLLGIAICGLASGIVAPPAYLLLSEISLIKYRGTLGSLNTMTNNGGYLYGLIVSKMVPFTFLPFVSIIPALLFLCLSCFLVESPLWYAKRGRIDLAKKTLEWLRGPDYFLNAELKELQNLTSKKTSTPRAMLMSRSFLIPLGVTLICFGTEVLTSIHLLGFYMITIVKKASLPIGGVTLAVLFQACATIAYMINPILMAKFKRRPIFLLCTTAMAFSLFSLGVLSYVGGDSLLVKLSWIGSMLMIFTMYGLGTGPVAFSLVGELFPPELRSLGCSLAMASRYIFSFLDVKMYSLLETALGMGGVYFLHGGFVAVGVGLTFLFLPETKDLSFTEIQRLYSENTVQEKEEISNNNIETTARRRSSVHVQFDNKNNAKTSF